MNLLTQVMLTRSFCAVFNCDLLDKIQKLISNLKHPQMSTSKLGNHVLYALLNKVDNNKIFKIAK